MNTYRGISILAVLAALAAVAAVGLGINGWLAESWFALAAAGVLGLVSITLAVLSLADD